MTPYGLLLPLLCGQAGLAGAGAGAAVILTSRPV